MKGSEGELFGVSAGESERQEPPGRSTFDVDVGKIWLIAAGVAAGTVAAVIMVGGGGPGVLVVLVLWVGGFLLVSRVQKVSRRAAVEDEARRLGLSFSPKDPFGLLELDFAPFVRFGKVPGTQGVENVVWGMRDGREVRAFDYWRAADEEREWFWCAIVRIPDWWPSLLIRRRGLFDVARNTVGLRDVEFELEAFNRLFEVRAADRRFASAVVDQRMMRWLLEPGPVHGFQLQRGWLVAWMPRLQASELERVLTFAEVFHERIPPAIWSLSRDGPPARPDLG